MLRPLLMAVVFVGTLAGLLFGSAGRFDLPFFWAYIAIVAVVMVVGLASFDRGLMKERLKPGPGGTDRHIRLMVLPFFVAHLLVAGLDVGRYHWSDTVPFALQIAGVAGAAASLSLSMWAVRTNRFFSPVVRIQSERGHHVITTGPYALIRHPGYAAAFANIPTTALALGSWWSLVPLAPIFLLIVRRTIIEDRFLHENLPGYAEYARKVRSRILPGLW